MDDQEAVDDLVVVHAVVGEKVLEVLRIGEAGPAPLDTPRQTWDLLETLPTRYPDHPIYQTNSCALAHVLRHSDIHGVHASPTCAANHCPADQRARCASAVPPPVTSDDVRSSLVWLGVPAIGSVDWNAEHRTATVQGSLSIRDRNNVSQRLVISVRASRDEADRYWSGRLEGGQPLVIDS